MERYFNLSRKGWIGWTWIDVLDGWMSRIRMNGPMDGQDSARMKLSSLDYNYK